MSARDEALAVFAALADAWDQRADRANVEMAAGAIHGCANELRQTLRDLADCTCGTCEAIRADRSRRDHKEER